MISVEIQEDFQSPDGDDGGEFHSIGQYTWVLEAQNAAPTTTTVQSGPSPSHYGQPVTFDAQVSNASDPSTGNTATPTGSVQFYVDGVPYESPVPVEADGSSLISDDDLPAGTHQITADFLPDNDKFDTSTSNPPDNQVVLPQLNLLGSPSWDTELGGVDFGYQVIGGPLPDDSSIDFYWASGPDETDELGGPIFSSPASGLATGTYGTYNVPASELGTPPTGAEYLLAAAHVGPADPQTDSVMSVAYDPFEMDSATSPDPKDISFTYDVNEAALGQPFDVGVYRSSSPIFDPSTAILVDQIPVPSLDSNGNLSEALGRHTDVISDPDALLPDPLHEYVFVVADPDHTIGDPDGTYHEAHFRKFVLGVVSHGLLPDGQLSGIPPWETTMAQDLRYIDKFNQVIPFDWSSTSNLPEPFLAINAGNNLKDQITSAADALIQNFGSPGDVVDLDLIGHSRGAVVISQALQDLYGTTDTALAGGYVKMTLLDPHPANNAYGLASFSTTSPFASLVARSVLSSFQQSANDPQVIIPPNVDAWDDVYQQTLASPGFDLTSPGESLMNLWGDDPTLIDNESGVLPSLDKNLSGMTLPEYGLIGHSEVPYFYDLYIVELGQIFPGYPLPDDSSDVEPAVAKPNQGQSAQSPAASPSAVAAYLSNSAPGQSAAPTIGQSVRVAASSSSSPGSPAVSATVVSEATLPMTPTSTQQTTKPQAIPGTSPKPTPPIPGPSVAPIGFPQTKSGTVTIAKISPNQSTVPVVPPPLASKALHPPKSVSVVNVKILPNRAGVPIPIPPLASQAVQSTKSVTVKVVSQPLPPKIIVPAPIPLKAIASSPFEED